MPNSNLLALFDTILNRVESRRDQARVENTLCDLARDLGVSKSVIEDALYCERGLVIYEP
jgi:hypothetical protein